MERRTLARYFLQRIAMGGNRLLELCRPALSLPEGLQGFAQKALGRGPLERRTLARYFLQRIAMGGNR